jgi:hypothetical protein
MCLWGYDNTGGSTSADGILLTWTNDCQFTNLYFYNCYRAIHTQRAWYCSFSHIRANGGDASSYCYNGLYMERQSTSHNYCTFIDFVCANTISSPFIIRDCEGSNFFAVETYGHQSGHGWDIGNGDANSVVQFLQMEDVICDSIPAGNYDAFHFEKGSTGGAFINIHISKIWVAGSVSGSRYGVYVSGAQDFQIIGGSIQYTVQHGVALSGSTRGLIADVHFTGYDLEATGLYDAIYSTTTDKFRIHDNHFNATNARRCITKDGYGNWNIHDNYMAEGGADAKMVSGATKAAADKVHHNNGFVTENSGQSTGTGSQQTIAHGLGFTPTWDQIALINAGVSANAYHAAIPDATNIYVTAVLGQSWAWATVGV